MSKRTGFAPAKPWRKRSAWELADIRTMRLTGATYRQIAEKYQISRERARQVVFQAQRKRDRVEKAKCRCCEPAPIWVLNIELTEAQLDWKRNRVECEFWIYKRVEEGTRYFGWREVYRANTPERT